MEFVARSEGVSIRFGAKIVVDGTKIGEKGQVTVYTFKTFRLRKS